jgi:phosphatidylethanolamine/phosphatidyl-N-methylethanolamine N-methyltransferase
MGLKHSYTLFAPFYDFLVRSPSVAARRISLQHLGNTQGKKILLAGVGTGLDFPLLPESGEYTGLDLTPAMLQRARQRRTDIALHRGNVMQMPYRDDFFDVVVMHLILAVVPGPPQALQEATRVLKPGGKILVLDKFLRPGQLAPLRRLVSPIIGKLATRMDVVFEDVLHTCPQLSVIQDNPVLARGWFRHIVLQKDSVTQ